MGLNRSTIMALTADLTAAGLVREELPRETGRAGRPSLVVRPESARVYVFAFDVGVGPAGRRPGRPGRRRSSTAGRRYGGAAPFALDEVVGTLAGFARQMRRRTRADTVCVGRGGGLLRRECGRGDGVVRFGPNLLTEDVPFGDELSRRLGLGLPVSVGNDANLAALAEHTRGVGVGCRGPHLPARRRRHRRRHHRRRPAARRPRRLRRRGRATWWSTPTGRACGCGSRGCLEAEVGERALLEAAGRFPPTSAAGTPSGPWSTPPTGATSSRRRR